MLSDDDLLIFLGDHEGGYFRRPNIHGWLAYMNVRTVGNLKKEGILVMILSVFQDWWGLNIALGVGGEVLAVA